MSNQHHPVGSYFIGSNERIQSLLSHCHTTMSVLAKLQADYEKLIKQLEHMNAQHYILDTLLTNSPNIEQSADNGYYEKEIE